MNEATPRQQLAEVLLDRPLADYVLEKRRARPRWSWRLIAEELKKDTDGKVAVTGQSLRMWFAGDSGPSDLSPPAETAA